MKIGLGAVQFGLDYGISNRSGQTPLAEVQTILSLANANGINVIDTAAAYGESEQVLGRAMPDKHNFRIISKMPGFFKRSVTPSVTTEITDALSATLDHLGVACIDGLLIHHADDLFESGGSHLMHALHAVRDAGLVKKIGVSVYTALQIEQLMAYTDIDLIQVPINLFDQRLLHGDLLSGLKSRGIEVHARSVFLQGLLLMDPDSLHSFFLPIHRRLAAFHAACNNAGTTPLAAALQFVLALEAIDIVLCGVNHHRQLQEICVAARGSNFLTETDQFSLRDDDEQFLNPARWMLQ
jgi:aryl-alcohol dehydrogenase-like predicted oxidoreductase